MSNETELRITLSADDESIAREILEAINSSGLVSWRELVNMYRGKGISLYRLKKILLALLNRGDIIELPCRILTTAEHLERTPKEVLREEIMNKIKSIKLRKCGKPIGTPYDKISISISRKGTINISIH